MAKTVINLLSLDGSNGFHLDVKTADNFFSDISVSNAGDVNGDGHDDVIIGADPGFSYVVFGKASGFGVAMDLSSLDGNNGFRLGGEGSGDSVSTAGDVNGDGFDDVIVGAPDAELNGRYSGSSYVVFGKPSGFSAAMDLSSLEGGNGFRLDGAASNSAGVSVSTAGDVNGDGFDDVIVGTDSVFSYVVFGKADGFNAPVDLSSLDGSNGFRLDTETKEDNSYVSVSTAGDVNGDGFDDVIVAASRVDRGVEYDNGIVGASRLEQDSNYWVSSYVVFGKATGFSATMNLSSLDGSDGFILDRGMYSSASGLAGASVSNAGDVNGDGFDDVIVGISRYGSGGTSYVVFGKASGFNAAMDLSSLDGKNGFRLDGGEENHYSGVSVSTAGDVNGDGFDDLIIASWRYQQYVRLPDSSYVVFGNASGFNAALNLSSLDEHDGFRLDGEVSDFSDDQSVSTAGDVNSDGFDDLIVGSSYIVFGRSDFGIGGLPKIAGTPEDDELKGTPVAEHFIAGDGNDRMIGGGGADVFHGDAGDDDIQVSDLYFGLVDGGIGNDVLHTDGKDLNLELADYLDKIQGIETIDLSGQGDNTLTLTGAELQELSDTTDTLTVQGNAGDRLILQGNWANGGSRESYHTYTQGDAVVLVESGVFTLGKTTINFSNLDGNNGFRLDDGGNSVSNAGDVNGDGFDDVIVGHPFADSNGYDSGSSYVVFGQASGFSAIMDLSSLDGKNGFRLDGREGGVSGLSVSNAGDVNGDDFDDVIVGVRVTDSNRYGSGSSYVVFGKATGFSAAMDLSSLDGANGFRLDGEAEFDHSYSVSAAGDMNGDGFDDVIVGARGADPNGERSGSSYVVFGKATGFSEAMNLSSLDGINGFRLDGETAYDYAGHSISTAGDVNGDGFDDVIVGAWGADPNGDSSGSSFVVFGKASGFSAVMDLSSLNGKNGFRLDGIAQRNSGFSVSNAGDVNGDGFDDVIVGASYRAYSYGDDLSLSYVVFGKSSGFDAEIDLSNLDGRNGFHLYGDSAAARFLHVSVSTAGDVNGDGFDDLIVSTFGTTYGIDQPDSSYVVFGKASGFNASMDLSNLNGNDGFRLNGERYASSSWSVSTAGDINGDGFDDLIVGDDDADPNGYGLSSGSSYIIFGSSDFGSGGLPEIVGTSEDDQLIGTSAAEHFKANDGDDRMIGLGGADVFHGSAGDDYIQVSDLGFALIDGGIGNDVLHTDGKDLNLVLTDYLGKIQGIETICLYGRGDNTLTLTGAELQELSDNAYTLKVHGNAGDRVILEGNWVDEGSHGFYHTYTQDDAVLLVGMNMAAVLA